MPPISGWRDSDNWVVEGARRAPDQGFLLSGLRRRTSLHGKPSKLTIAVTGSTVLTAAAASGVVALWPATMGSQSAASMVATSGTISSQAHLDGSATLGSQVLTSRAVFALRQQQTAALVAQQAAARQAALRQRAAELAARRAAAQAAADRAAQQQAQQQQAAQQTQPSQVTSAPAVPSGSAQQIAMGMLGSYGWSSSQFSCLNSLWNEESGWNVYATNPSSGAYGIPQALPGSKMASAGPDWQTDAATQIRWGLTYIKSLYGSPCGAWAHEEADGWY
jgi:hypothetical protein